MQPGRTTRTSKKAGICETLMSFAQKRPTASPTPPGHSSSLTPPPPDFLFPPDIPNDPNDPPSPQEEVPHDDQLPPDEEPEPQGAGERDLAQALEHLANKIAGMPSASKS